jgi:hypothetical protein
MTDTNPPADTAPDLAQLDNVDNCASCRDHLLCDLTLRCFALERKFEGANRA